ncbi:prephenate dehydrogenase [Rhodococcus pyridinivorans]|uniref:Prephenate dehydrogenase n=1 Tax=Rhodococcus pyridinivorans AK37 TaxID=1114960 RepID=H0JYS3_9NOCA|nr:prephenate dehydrogenase [Rhodococcus pyridinivorans]EHK80399.1 prephenate dehydrogenase [Rhodococcus pyridinivorans AK37]MCD2143492.1 prephenate dehydrogenase [Rhodococcus pyridinivorans]
MTTPGRVIVAGGCGAVGALLTGALREAGRQVLVVDPAAAPAAPGMLRADLTAPDTRLAAALDGADIVVLAVPDVVAGAALPVLARLLPPHTLLVETLSVKTPIAAALHTYRPGAPTLGINPMFAPDLGLPGRPVVAVRHHDAPVVTEFVAALRDWGATVVETTADEHDRITAAVQVLTHAAILAFGIALDRLDVPDAAARVAAPPHTVLRALLARVSGGTAEVYHDIQLTNPYAVTARRALAGAVADLDAATDALPDFAVLLDRARAALGDGQPAAAQLCGQLFAALPRDPGAVGGPSEERSRT